MKHRKTAALQHDDRACHYLLLDCFLLFQRNRKRLALDRSRAAAPKCEASCAGCLAAQSIAQTSRTPARDCFALYERGRHSWSAPVDPTTGSLIRQSWIFPRILGRTSRLSLSAGGAAKIAFPAISIPSPRATGWRPRVRVASPLACARVRPTNQPFSVAAACQTRPAFCSA